MNKSHSNICIEESDSEEEDLKIVEYKPTKNNVNTYYDEIVDSDVESDDEIVDSDVESGDEEVEEKKKTVLDTTTNGSQSKPALDKITKWKSIKITKGMHKRIPKDKEVLKKWRNSIKEAVNKLSKNGQVDYEGGDEHMQFFSRKKKLDSQIYQEAITELSKMITAGKNVSSCLSNGLDEIKRNKY